MRRRGEKNEEKINPSNRRTIDNFARFRVCKKRSSRSCFSRPGPSLKRNSQTVWESSKNEALQLIRVCVSLHKIKHCENKIIISIIFPSCRRRLFCIITIAKTWSSSKNPTPCFRVSLSCRLLRHNLREGLCVKFFFRQKSEKLFSFIHYCNKQQHNRLPRDGEIGASQRRLRRRSLYFDSRESCGFFVFNFYYTQLRLFCAFNRR